MHVVGRLLTTIEPFPSHVQACEHLPAQNGTHGAAQLTAHIPSMLLCTHVLLAVCAQAEPLDILKPMYVMVLQHEFTKHTQPT